MNAGRFVGRIGVLAVALGVGNARRAATQMTVPIGVAAMAVTLTVVSVSVSAVSPDVKLSADSTALILGGTTVPRWHDADVEVIMNQFVTPTHPGQTITPIAVTTPEEYWPITGLFRLVGSAVGDPRIWGPGGAGWPDEPWWKLSGLFDLTIDQSVRAGVVDLEQAMAEHGNDHLVIYGLSQGATVANTEKRKLAKHYPTGTTAPDIDFVLQGDPNLPNGGLSSRFAGLYIPFLDLTFDGPAPTDTQFDTVEINRQYDGAADFPLYPLNLIATANALLGFVYLHTNPFDVSLPEDPTTSPAYQGTHGDTSYYLFETENLPLFAPLRSLGVPEPLIDVFEPFFRVLVELGYDRSIPPWEPTPARLIPTLDPVKVVGDLIDAIGEGITNALHPVYAPPAQSVQAAVARTGVDDGVSFAAPAVESDEISTETVPRADRPTQTEQSDSAEAATAGVPVSTSAAPSTSEVTGSVETDEGPMGQTEVSVLSGSAAASTAEEAEPTARSVTPRAMVRDSLRALPQSHGSSHRSIDATASTAATTAAATTEGSSSAASPVPSDTSSAAGASAADDSVGGDAGSSD